MQISQVYVWFYTEKAKFCGSFGVIFRVIILSVGSKNKEVRMIKLTVCRQI